MLIITPDVVRLGGLQCMEVISTEGLSKRHDCLTQNDQNDTSLCHLDHFVFVGGQSSLCILKHPYRFTIITIITIIEEHC